MYILSSTVLVCIANLCIINYILHLTAIIADITEDVIRPLLRSAVPSDEITPRFNASLDNTLLDIINSLNGSNVNLTRTLFNYFMAVSRVYFDEAVGAVPFSLNLNIDQIGCGVRAVFRHVYTNADAAAELVELFQNMSQAVRIIKQVCTYIATYF